MKQNLKIVAYKFTGETEKPWCAGIFNGTQPILDSANDGVGFATKREALAWAKQEKAKLNA